MKKRDLMFDLFWLGDSAELYQLGFQDPATTTMEGIYLFNLHLLFVIKCNINKLESIDPISGFGSKLN